MKIVLHALGLFVFGSLALIPVAVLFEVREGQPLPPPNAPSALAGEPRPRARVGTEILAAGLRTDLDIARTALTEGRRSEATHALDAAMRLTEVAGHATREDVFERAGTAVRHARRALQNGDPANAHDVLHRAEVALRDAVTRGLGPAAPPPDDLAAYVGATVVNAQGIKVGEVVDTRSNELALRVGGVRDIFGLFDVPGGRRLDLPPECVLFGKRRTIGRH